MRCCLASSFCSFIRHVHFIILARMQKAIREHKVLYFIAAARSPSIVIVGRRKQRSKTELWGGSAKTCLQEDLVGLVPHYFCPGSLPLKM